MFKRSFHQQSAYSRWDGTQSIDGVDAEDILEALTDDYLQNHDLKQALQRLQREGFRNADGQPVMGLREMLQRLRQQQQARLQRYNMSGIMDDIEQQLERIVQMERTSIQRRLDETGQNAAQESVRGQPMPPDSSSTDAANMDNGKELRKILETIAKKKTDFLDALPKDTAGQIRELSQYDFMDDQARQEFQDLLQSLQQQVMQQYFQGMQQSLAQMTPEDLARMRNMIRDLNAMLRDREDGRNPDFDSFMQKYGDFFGPGINTLDDLIEDFQRRSAQMQAIFDSMSPEQREQLQSMMDQLIGDDRIRVDLAELAQHIENQGVNDFRTRYSFNGDEPITLTEALSLMNELQGLDELEAQIQSANRGKGLEDIDIERLRELVGPEEATALDELRSLMRQLEEAGLLKKEGNSFELTSHGIRKIGQKALKDIFAQLQKDAFGQHQIPHQGQGGERIDDSKRYSFGDPFLLDLRGTLQHAIERNGPGMPVQLMPDDFEVFRTEMNTQSSTVLMIDMSVSMLLGESFHAAKKVAIALEALIRGQFPRDMLHVVGFSRMAREFKRDELIHISKYDHSQGTNMIHGLMVARKLLSSRQGTNKQIIMITDGGPTVMWDKESNEWMFTYPYTYPAELQTLLEVQRCTRAGITINTFMLVRDPNLVDFVKNMSEINKGRAFFSEPENLGKYLLVDYLASKRSFRTT